MHSEDSYLLNKLFYDTQRPDVFADYRRDPDAFLARYPVSPEVRAIVQRNDVAAMYRTGANPYLLRYYCLNLGVPEPEFLGALQWAKV